MGWDPTRLIYSMSKCPTHSKISAIMISSAFNDNDIWNSFNSKVLSKFYSPIQNADFRPKHVQRTQIPFPFRFLISSHFRHHPPLFLLLLFPFPPPLHQFPSFRSSSSTAASVTLTISEQCPRLLHETGSQDHRRSF